MEEDEALNLVDIGVFSFAAIVFDPSDYSHLIQEFVEDIVAVSCLS